MGGESEEATTGSDVLEEAAILAACDPAALRSCASGCTRVGHIGGCERAIRAVLMRIADRFT
jgi:hypothetical protein